MFIDGRRSGQASFAVTRQVVANRRSRCWLADVLGNRVIEPPRRVTAKIRLTRPTGLALRKEIVVINLNQIPMIRPINAL
jgi:hypothetical protein